MKAFAVDSFGEPGSLREVEDPKPEAGELLLRVEGAGVNVVDTWVINGALKDMMEHRFPLIPGVEVAGVIQELGSDVTGFSEGDRVYGVSPKPFFGSGTFAEFATVPSQAVAASPAKVDAIGAAAMPHTALTAMAIIDEVNPGDGTELLIIGATGGVGSYLTQMAAQRGAKVVGVSRAENADYARSLGAKAMIDYTQGDLVDLVQASHPSGFHAVIDLFGDAQNLARLSESVVSGGFVVSTSGGADLELLPKRGLKGANVNRASPDRLDELTKLVDEGTLKVPPTRVYPLEEAVSALAEMGSRHTRGKVVIKPN